MKQFSACDVHGVAGEPLTELILFFSHETRAASFSLNAVSVLTDPQALNERVVVISPSVEAEARESTTKRHSLEAKQTLTEDSRGGVSKFMQYECNKCHKTLPEREFDRDKHTKRGRLYMCRWCLREYRAGKHPSRKSIKRNPVSPLIENAQRAVREAVRIGLIVKPVQCQSCQKETEARNLSGHHEDYSLALSVVWLCQRCHAAIHMQNGVHSLSTRKGRSVLRGAGRSDSFN